MDTSDYAGDPNPDAVARAVDPAIASVASALLRDADLGLDSVLESVRAHEAALEPFPGPVTPPGLSTTRGEVMPDPKAVGPIAEPRKR